MTVGFGSEGHVNRSIFDLIVQCCDLRLEGDDLCLLEVLQFALELLLQSQFRKINGKLDEHCCCKPCSTNVLPNLFNFVSRCHFRMTNLVRTGLLHHVEPTTAGL